MTLNLHVPLTGPVSGTPQVVGFRVTSEVTFANNVTKFVSVTVNAYDLHTFGDILDAAAEAMQLLAPNWASGGAEIEVMTEPEILQILDIGYDQPSIDIR